MAKTYSKMIDLNTNLKNFNLFDPKTGNQTQLYNENMQYHGYLLAFICNHCPYVKLIKAKMSELFNSYLTKNIGVVAINSNDIDNYPDDAPEKMLEDCSNFKYEFDYLFDESQEVAKYFQAQATPDFYLFNSDKKLVYRGRFDEANPSNNITPTGIDLDNAVNALLNNGNISTNQLPSIGCNIKWKK